jgi:hypothetical protein
MEASELMIRLIVLLIPGVIAALIIETLTVHKAWDKFRFMVYAILLGFASYALLQLVLGIIWFTCRLLAFDFTYTKLGSWASLFNAKDPIDVIEVMLACGASVILGGGLSAIIQYKVTHRIARWLRISDKYGDENLFSFFLNAKEVTWICIRMPSKNLTYEGWRESFSETDKIREIVLRDVRVYRYEDSALLYEVPAIYLCLPVDDIVIEMPT